jgi:Hpt domain
MAPAKPRKPDTITHADHEVIMPDTQTLRQAVVPGTPGDEDPIARAEQALSQIANEFDDWMARECDRLDAARRAVTADGLTAKTLDQLYRPADDINGSAKTLGFPEAAPIANSLCRLIEHSPDIARIPLALIDQHVAAIRALVRDHKRPDFSEMARNLTHKLCLVTEEFLAHENRHRPEYLRAISSPSLAP